MIVQVDALQPAEKIEMPEGAPEFTIGRELHADVFLLLDQLLDLFVLDRLELRGRDLALLALGARLLQALGAQEAADLVGAERRSCTLRHEAFTPVF